MKRKNNAKNISKKIIKQAKGITLISLVITIIILLILAGVTLSLTLGDNGIITQAGKAKEAQEIAAIKEDFQLAILDKELEKGGTGLTQEELEEIAGNYGELQEDGNTIKTEEGYEIKIDEIYKPGGGTGGGSGATDEEIAALEEKIKELEQTVEDLTNTKTELEGTIEDLNGQLEQAGEDKTALEEQIENLQGQVDSLNKTIEQQQNTINDLNTQIADLQKKQSTGNATVADVLEGKTFSNGTQIGLTGTIKNRGTLNWSGSNTTYNIPAGYYSGGTLDSRPSYNAGVTAADNRSNPNSTNYKTGYNAGVTAADNRVNTNSTNYKTGYNNGYNAGVSATTGRKKTITSGAINKQKFKFVSGSSSERWCVTFNPGTGVAPYAIVLNGVGGSYRPKTTYIREGNYFYCARNESDDATDVITLNSPAMVSATSCVIPTTLTSTTLTSFTATVYY